MRQALRRFSSFQISVRRLAVHLTALIVAVSVVVTPSIATAAKYAAIVMDARTGKILHSENADARRYPASLTKMMTLYLVFEALSQGKIKKSTPVRFSAQAATQPPTKIGVKAGGSISVETAIYSLITRSANDSAMALAELLGGSQQNFARMMTTKARALGMKSTVFRNPHGLPDTGQFTTARDMAMLGIALREHYPQYYGYFSTKSFRYGRTRIANHNKLLGRIKGVDGIKTGYTRASGFNLVSSVSDGNRRLVAVVMGGDSGRSRDARMAKLITAYMPKTSTRGGTLIARADGGGAVSKIAKMILPKRNAPEPEVRPADDEVEVEVASVDSEEEVTMEGAAAQPIEERFGAQPKRATRQQQLAPATTEQAYAQPTARPKTVVDPISTASTGGDGWVVQVASSPSQSEAKAALARASERGSKILASAEGFTVAFEKDGVTYHRARFGGFPSQNAATKACGQLKKKKIACYAVAQ